MALLDDDDLPGDPGIDISTLSDDPAQLKRHIGQLMSANAAARRSDKNQRERRKAAEAQIASLTSERDEIKAKLEKERDDIKATLETANRSNGQLRSKFREQFVDARVRAELEKRGAKNVDDAMKLLDPSGIEFDEENLEIKDAAGLATRLDEFAKQRDYLFGAAQKPGPQPIRGTTFGRGASDVGGTTDKTKLTFDDKTRSVDDLVSEILGI